MRVQGRLHVPNDLPVRAMTAPGHDRDTPLQLSFDEVVLREESLEEIAAPRESVEEIAVPRESLEEIPISGAGVEEVAMPRAGYEEITMARSRPGGVTPRGRALTDEQEQAVARRTEPLSLAAGAGSGKTSVLAERFVRAVLEDGVPPARILAITFTERAAGELRERVRTRFKELGEREAARDTEAAFVSTFHGFCARILRRHPLVAGLDPEFAILEEGLAGRLRGQAWANALAGFLEGERSAAVDLVAAWGADRVRAMVVGTYAELRSKGEQMPRLPEVFQLTLPTSVSQATAPELSPWDEMGEEASPEQPSSDPGSADPAAVGLGSADPASTGLASADPVPAGLAPADLGPADLGPAGQVPADPAAAGDATARELGEITAQGSQACTLLDELLERFGRAYTALKQARGAVDFDDLELDTRALLEAHEGVRKTWSERFELMMVDEFQDTNPRQLAILSALERGNLFTVGDELQSIYGFRHADVSLFRARRDALAEQGASLSLTRNFRSRKPLLDTVNAVFGERFLDRYTPLQAGRAAEGAEEPIVELLLTHKRGWDDDERLAERLAGDLPSAPRWRQAEARLLAQRVAELVDSGATKPGEVAVLLRAVGDLEVYERALQEHGLNTLATVGGFWGGQQVGDLVAYLGALANPLDELALYGTLASPLVGVSSDALALLGAAAKASKRSVWETLEGVSEDRVPAVRLPPGDRALLVEFVAYFEAERAAAGRWTISGLIERALETSGYLEQVLSLSWPERRLANVHKLLRVARRYEVSEGRDLRGFLDHVTHQQGSLGGAEPDAPVADGEADAVRLMSIHAAKGLEFGVVCVADLGRAQNLSVGDLLVDGARVGLRLASLDGSGGTPSLAWEELAQERKQAQVEEEDRILYVAMTRARERLLLSGAVDLERWPDQKLGAPSISWLGPALSPELPKSVQTLHPPVRELPVEAHDGTPVRVGLRLNAPETLGTVLRLEGRLDKDDPSPTRVETIATGDEKEEQQTPPSLAQTTGDLTRPEADPRVADAAPLEASVRPEASMRPDDSGRPDTLSYTSLAELARCGYRFYLERVLHLPEQRPPALVEDGSRNDGLEARLRGTVIHRLLESLDFMSPVAPSVQDIAKVAHELDVRVARGEREELAVLLRSALATPLATRLSAAARSARREHPFVYSLEPGAPLLTGVIDILLREPSGEILVVDYKSDRISPEEDLEALVEREYSIQRLLYALAVLSDGAPRVEVIHWFLHRSSEPVSAVFTAADKPRLEVTIAELVKHARALPFIVSKNPHRGLCLTCPGRSRLCSWSDSDTLRERVGA
jgi:ATP-dependent helicase/nuclease subunit A